MSNSLRMYFTSTAQRPHSKTGRAFVLPRNENAFSLVEVLCAILILGVGLAGLTHGVTTALASSKEAELQTTAALFAAGQIELLRADGFIVEGEDEGECGADLPLYRWRQTVSTTGTEGLYEVEVVIENSKTGKAIYDLKTMLFDPPLTTSESSGGSRESSRERERRQRRNR